MINNQFVNGSWIYEHEHGYCYSNFIDHPWTFVSYERYLPDEIQKQYCCSPFLYLLVYHVCMTSLLIKQSEWKGSSLASGTYIIESVLDDIFSSIKTIEKSLVLQKFLFHFSFTIAFSYTSFTCIYMNSSKLAQPHCGLTFLIGILEMENFKMTITI